VRRVRLRQRCEVVYAAREWLGALPSSVDYLRGLRVVERRSSTVGLRHQIPWTRPRRRFGSLASLPGARRPQRKADEYSGILDAALHHTRQAASGHRACQHRDAARIGRIAKHVRLPDWREARHCHLFASAGLRDLRELFYGVKHANQRIEERTPLPPREACPK
jgi:hypothetical protein